MAGVDQVGEEHGPPYDSESHGALEAACKQIRGRLRTMALCLEKRIGKRIPPRRPVLALMFPHAGSIINHSVRGLDGTTPFENLRMRPRRDELVWFAGKMKFKLRSKDVQLM